MTKPDSNYVGQPAKPVNHVQAIDGDAGVQVVLGFVVAFIIVLIVLRAKRP